MQSKQCTKCGEVKPVSGFYRNRSQSDGLRGQCKECSRSSGRAYDEARREDRRAYRDEHKEEIRAYQRAYRDEHKEEIRAYDEARREDRRAYHRDYYDAHREECVAKTRKWITETQNASREVSTRNHEPWTTAEDHVVLTSEGTRLEIAIALGRTTNSVANRRRILRRKAVTA